MLCRPRRQNVRAIPSIHSSLTSCCARKHKCNCDACALAVLKDSLRGGKAIRCPVCREVVHRIVIQDASDERKSQGMRRSKSAMLARELLQSEAAVRRTSERLAFGEDVKQIVIEEVLDKGFSDSAPVQECCRDPRRRCI